MASYASGTQKLCQAQHCRYSQFHTTEGHLCGICNKYGHGQIECGNKRKIDKLLKYSAIFIPINQRCTVIGCDNSWTHRKESHHCHKCLRNHSSEDCIIQNLSDYNGKFGIDSEKIRNIEFYFNNISSNDFIIIYAGMGCNIYFRKTEDNIEGLFMHSDSWGQYGGVANSDKPILDKFIENLTNKTDNFLELDLNNLEFSTKTIECPLCRTINEESKVVEVKGLKEECSICYSNNVELYFPECKHAIVCKDCFKHL